MKILRILTTVFFALLVSIGLSAASGAPLPLMFGGLLLFSFIIPKQSGVMNIALFDMARAEGSNIGGGGGIDSEIILIPVDNVDLTKWPDRTAKGGAIEDDIPLKPGCYMHRFYATEGTIKPTQKKAKGSNKDSGGYEVGVEVFHPGLEEAILDWIASFGYSFKGFVIIQNCANTKKYLLGEPCNLVSVDDLESMWGEEVNKDKGNKIIFKGMQGKPFCIYKGAITYDPGSTSW